MTDIAAENRTPRAGTYQRPDGFWGYAMELSNPPEAYHRAGFETQGEARAALLFLQLRLSVEQAEREKRAA